METRQIEISLDTAKRLYEQGGEYRDIALTAFEEYELLGWPPKTWQEFCENYKVQKNECYIGNDSFIMKVGKNDISDRNRDMDCNLLPSMQAAEAHLALMQLHQLRDVWRDGWLPDWGNELQSKRIICNYKGEITVSYSIISRFLSFQDEKRAKEFLECFKDLIEKAGDLI